ncbi:hypothetical protein O6H91_01G036800 [Diphasiastrum complanatum]|uniref:Uncharacterized protein n=1 Tax=Diphasiastrum complanatum TaxID=34168 RepID=A0ACC2EQ56_DIPCM|nr:hypothetical protein O6H91_01G036800 [Diphasiastrum complanatum]
MPLFMSEEELDKAGDNVGAVVARADACIGELQVQLETQRARAGAASINAEQNCLLIEQKYMSLVAQCSRVETENSQLHSALERRSAELAQAQANLHKLELASMKQDNNVEHLSFELKGVQKAKRELLELVEQKSLELDEKNGSIKAYLEKVVSLTEERGRLEGKLHESEADLIRLRAGQARMSQEKELVEQHNEWLNEEISSKVNALLEERSKSREAEADLCARLSEAEKVAKEVGEALDRSTERVKDLETKLYQAMEDLRFTKEDAAAKEDHLTTEVTTASKLADLYKQSSEEWAKKANELEGVIKALEVHLNQVEADYNLKLQKEIDARQQIVKEAADSKEKMEKKLKEAEMEASKFREKDLHLLTWDNGGRSNLIDGDLAIEVHGSEMTLPQVPFGVSGTALAATLLRDGWSLAKLYGKYQEAVDALRHERQARNHSEALLERVLHEIEQKAEMIMDERTEHRRMVHAYRTMEEKLHFSMSDQASLENSIKEMKADFRKKERELKGAQKEISDLQTQVAVLLKECADIQQRYKVVEGYHHSDGTIAEFQSSVLESSASDAVISDKLLTFKDIHGMVEHNSQMRALVRDLALQIEQKEMELKEAFNDELKKCMDEESQKLAAMLTRSEEQNEVIEALRGTVGMYKRLYEEESSSRRVFQLESSSPLTTSGAAQELRRLLEKSQEEANRAKEEAAARLRSLEEDLNKAKHEVHKSVAECARADAEASYAREKLQSVMKESEKQRKEMEAVLLRNMEFSQTITEYQRRLRESSQKTEACEEQSRRLSIEVSVLEREKELLVSAEKRASQEVSLLSERVHRLQATLDTIHNVEEVRELSRGTEKRRLEDEVNRMQKEWAELKHELELERGHVRNLTTERDRAVSQAMDRVEILSKELADALAAVSAAETRAQISKARSAELEASLRKAEDKILVALSSGKKGERPEAPNEDIDAEIMSTLQQAQEEVQHLREDLVASNSHLEQYKKIAQANEEALKEMEEVHMRFKAEAAHMRQANDMEMEILRKRLSELELLILEKEKAMTIAAQERETSKSITSKHIADLSQSLATKQAALAQAEEQIQALKEDLDRQYIQWREAQCNYERQVLLQADTIRELNSASEKLSKLEKEVAEFQKRAEKAEADLLSARVSWEMEKSCLEMEKVEAENRSKDSDEQNQLLLNRLEAKHIQLAEKELTSSTEVSKEKLHDTQEEADLQNIIKYLRRAKETADTEISLLKQERLRLHKQLEAATRSAEEAQASLRREHENTRASLYTFEEFKNLKTQVREMNLLRESNAQLREENRRNFEDSRESRENARKAQEELEPLRRSIREKEIELEAAGSELDTQKAEIQRWQTRVSQLLEKYKAIDVEDHHRTRKELSETQERIKISEDAINLAKKESEEVKEKLLKMEQDIASRDERITELEKRLQESVQTETSCKTELDRFKRHVAFLKRKIETLGKEKEEMSKEIEELKANGGKKPASEASRIDAVSRQEAAAKQEQAQKEADLLLKEKETRIQTLEKVLEKEREELRKERAKRKEDQKYFVDVAQKANQEKKRFLEEMEGLKREREQYFEQAQLNDAKLSEQSGKGRTEERVNSYQAAVDQMLEEAFRVSPEIAAVVASTAPSAAPAPISSDIVPTSILVEAAPVAVEPTHVADVLIAGVSNTFTSASGAISSSPAASTNAIPLTTAIIPMVTAVTNTSTVPVTSFITRSSTRPLSVSTVPILRPSTRSVTATAAPIPAGLEAKEEKERAIQQLRAMIQEKEKVQARKPARRIIRPRIEPSGQQDSVLEGAEHTFELSAEGTEAEAEALEYSKSGLNSEAIDNASILHADNIPVVVLPEQSVTDMTATRTTVSIVRKRSASVSEQTPSTESGEQEGQSEAPQIKKLKGTETASGVVFLKSALLLTEAGSLSSDIRDVQMDSRPIEDPEFLAQNKLGARPPSPEITSGKETDEVHVDEKREDDFKDLPAPKRTRLSTPELSIVRAEELQKEDRMDDDGLPDKLAVSSQDGTVDAITEGMVPVDEDVEAQPYGNLPSGDADIVGSTSVELEQQIQPVLLEIEDTSGAVDISGVFPDTNLPTMMPPRDIVFAELNVSDSSKESAEENSQNQKEPDRLNQESRLNEGEIMTTASDNENDASIGGSGVGVMVESMEEGEIMVESLEGTIPAAKTEPFDDHEFIGELPDKIERDDATGKLTVDIFDTPLEKREDSARVDTLELTVEPGATPSAPESVGAGDTASAEPKEDKLTKDTPVSIAPQSSTLTRKGTTIHLAERARERSIVRRGGISPPSPGARGGRGRAQRGAKRATAASRGRVISTGVRVQGQPEAAAGEAESAAKGQTVQRGGSPPTMSANQSDVPKEEEQ